MNLANNIGSNVSFYDKLTGYKNSAQTYMRFLNHHKHRYKNFVSVIYNVLTNNYPFKAVTREGNALIIEDYQQLYNHLLGLEVDDKEDLVYCQGQRFYGGKANGDLFNIFNLKEYSFLPVQGKVVIDIGANIGDSSIFFALNGARRVVSLEPDRDSYENLKKNITINGFSDIIDPMWAGCSSNDLEGVNEVKPRSVTLKTILKTCVLSPEILKIDCEGCEYEVISASNCEELQQFSHIQIEYHYGYKNIKKILELCGFDVKVTGPSYFVPLNLNKMASQFYKSKVIHPTRMYMGWVFATRK